MKKVISLLMTALILLSVVPASFAAEVTTADNIVPTFASRSWKQYSLQTRNDGEFVLCRTANNTDTAGQAGITITLPSTLQNANAATNYSSAKWYKIDFDWTMKTNLTYYFQFKDSSNVLPNNNVAYIPNYCTPTGVSKNAAVAMNAGEKLDITILYDLKSYTRYFFINNILVGFQTTSSSDIGKTVTFIMNQKPTIGEVTESTPFDIVGISNITGKLYDATTTIEDMGLYNWMYTEIKTEEGYTYSVEASCTGAAMFNGTSVSSNSIGAYVAGFNSEGMLLGIAPFRVISGSAFEASTFTTDEKISEIKLFIWDNKGQLTPVIPSTKPMQVETFKPATAGFATQVN